VTSPFPGLDPYLEQPALWPEFQHQLLASLYHLLLPGLVDRYRARIATRKFTSELVLFTSIQREEHEEEYLEIRSRATGKTVVLLEAVSLANRTTVAGRAAYLATRKQAQLEGAATAEFDLITQGKPLLDFERSGLPLHDGTITVTRGATPERFEIYASSVRKRLPKFRLPLAPDDRDTVVDLQLAYLRAFDQGRFETLIDYTKPLPPDMKLTDDDRTWIARQIQSQKPQA
jgi:hypothetical protein